FTPLPYTSLFRSGSLGKKVPSVSFIYFFTPVSIQYLIISSESTDNCPSDNNSNQLAGVIDNGQWCFVISHRFKYITQQCVRMHSRDIRCKDIFQTFTFFSSVCCLVCRYVTQQLLLFINHINRGDTIFFH